MMMMVVMDRAVSEAALLCCALVLFRDFGAI